MLWEQRLLKFWHEFFFVIILKYFALTVTYFVTSTILFLSFPKEKWKLFFPKEKYKNVLLR